MPNTLYVAPTANFVQKTLSGAIANSDTTITLSSTTNLQAPGMIIVDRIDSAGNLTSGNREVISYTGISSNQLTGCTRGADNSSAIAHADGAVVETAPTVGMWNNLATIIASGLDNNGYLKAINSPVSVAFAQLNQAAITSIASITYGQFTQINVASIASIAQIALTNLTATSIIATNATITGRLNVGQIAINSIASVAAVEFNISNQDGHLDIRPGVSKLVKTAVLKQNITSNAYRNSSVMLTGWGFLAGSGTRYQNITMTFGISFATIPIVTGNVIGQKTGSDPTTQGDLTSGNISATFNPASVTTSGFTGVVGMADAAETLGATVRAIFTWIAIGEL